MIAVKSARFRCAALAAIQSPHHGAWGTRDRTGPVLRPPWCSVAPWRWAVGLAVLIDDLKDPLCDSRIGVACALRQPAENAVGLSQALLQHLTQPFDGHESEVGLRVGQGRGQQPEPNLVVSRECLRDGLLACFQVRTDGCRELLRDGTDT